MENLIPPETFPLKPDPIVMPPTILEPSTETVPKNFNPVLDIVNSVSPEYTLKPEPVP
jgi:hypothetical protein